MAYLNLVNGILALTTEDKSGKVIEFHGQNAVDILNALLDYDWNIKQYWLPTIIEGYEPDYSEEEMP